MQVSLRLSLFQEVAEPLQDLKEGMSQLEKNKTLCFILSTLLAIGNFLNGSNVSYGCAHGLFPSSLLFSLWGLGGEAKEVIKDWKHTYSKPLSVGKRTKQVKAVSCHLGYFPFLFRPGLQHCKADLGAGQWLPVLYHIWLRFSYLQANEAFMWTCIRADYWPAWLFQSILYYCLMELMVISSAVAE